MMVESLIAPFDAYKGDDPYIFVSYAHKNSEIVFEHITRLRNAGFRIWYDEGIDPGTDWSEEIAIALSNAAALIVFISPAAVESHNVKKEIVFAIDQRKHMICIHVENTELPVGLKLQLGNIQSLLEDRFIDQEKFYARLFDALPEETREVDRNGVPVLAASGKAKRRRTQGTIQQKKYKTVFIAAGFVLVLGLSAFVTVNLTRKDETPPSSTVTTQTSDVVKFADAKLEAAIREELNKPSGELTITDLASIADMLDLSGQDISDITPLRYMKKLTYLVLNDNNITDISALQGLRRLRALKLKNNRITDISAVQETPNLVYLDLNGNQIKDITPVRSLKDLTTLSLSNNPVSDLRPLEDMKQLRMLYIDGVSLQESDLQPLLHLCQSNLFIYRDEVVITKCRDQKLRTPQTDNSAKNSEAVKFADANLEAAIREELNKPKGELTIGDLANIAETLNLSGKGISDITPLRHMEKLSTLYLDNNRITDISALKKLDRLSHLDVGNNRITDISALREIPNLIELTLDDNQIKDITPVRSLKKLMILSLNNNPVSDLRPLATMKSLWTLSIDGVALQESDLQLGLSLSQLVRITVSDASFVNLTEDQIRTFRNGIQNTTFYNFQKNRKKRE